MYAHFLGVTLNPTQHRDKPWSFGLEDVHKLELSRFEQSVSAWCRPIGTSRASSEQSRWHGNHRSYGLPFASPIPVHRVQGVSHSIPFPLCKQQWLIS
eukprot:COSAG02_NODE_5137_length_4597_cov_1.972210_2_plen_98_part_00